MKIAFAASTGGFYDSAIHQNIPADAVEISLEKHRALLAAQASGQVITADATGNPVAVDPRSLMTLSELQGAQVARIEAAYQAAIQAPVSYMSTLFQADEASQSILARCLSAGSVPTGFFWLDAQNNQVAMSYAQLQGLAAAMLAQGQTAFAKKTQLKTQIRAATTRTGVDAVVWA